MTATLLRRQAETADPPDAHSGGHPQPARPVGERRMGVLLTVGGLIGLMASATLLIEKIELLKNPYYVPSCSINPILSCGSIMNTPQAELLGFPNPILGVLGFSVVLTVGVSLLAGATYPPWFWRALQVSAALGTVFVHWLIFQSLYRINALCPYCMVVWVTTTTVFWYVTLHNWHTSPASRVPFVAQVVRISTEFHAVVITSWAVIIGALIAHRFWDYWLTVIPN